MPLRAQARKIFAALRIGASHCRGSVWVGLYRIEKVRLRESGSQRHEVAAHDIEIVAQSGQGVIVGRGEE
jgi:hypothetical protein